MDDSEQEMLQTGTENVGVAAQTAMHWSGMEIKECPPENN